MDIISVQKRDLTLKAKKMRKNGLIPGSVYGKAIGGSVDIQMDEATARRLIWKKREGSRLNLELDGKTIPVQIKEESVDSLTNEIMYINFQALKAGERVNSVVHIILKNTDKVTGLLENMITEVPYSAFPRNMIDTVTVDVDGMPIGTVLTVGDIEELATDKLDLQIDKDEIVLRISEKKSLAEEPAEETETAE